MELKIEKTIKSTPSQIILLHAIKEIKEFECLDHFIRYVEIKDEDIEDVFEKKYLNILRKKVHDDIILKINKIAYKDKSPEELLELINELMADGFWGIKDREIYDICYYLRNRFTSKEMYPIIKEIMIEAYDETMEQVNKSRNEQKISELKTSIECKKEQLAEIADEISNLNKQISELSK